MAYFVLAGSGRITVHPGHLGVTRKPYLSRIDEFV